MKKILSMKEFNKVLVEYHELNATFVGDVACKFNKEVNEFIYVGRSPLLNFASLVLTCSEPELVGISDDSKFLYKMDNLKIASKIKKRDIIEVRFTDTSLELEFRNVDGKIESISLIEVCDKLEPHWIMMFREANRVIGARLLMPVESNVIDMDDANIKRIIDGRLGKIHSLLSSVILKATKRELPNVTVSKDYPTKSLSIRAACYSIEYGDIELSVDDATALVLVNNEKKCKLEKSFNIYTLYKILREI